MIETVRGSTQTEKYVLPGIGKRGDTVSAYAFDSWDADVIRFAKNRPANCWLNKLPDRQNRNVAAVAVANKNTRIVWALLTQGGQRLRAQYALSAHLRKQEWRDGE